jgi:hypothetical protein
MLMIEPLPRSSMPAAPRESCWNIERTLIA